MSTTESLAEQRATLAARVRPTRYRTALAAVISCGLTEAAEILSNEDLGCLPDVRARVQSLRSRRSDEPGYAATGVALEALGRLWAVS
jgi:hypothetical protein